MQARRVGYGVRPYWGGPRQVKGARHPIAGTGAVDRIASTYGKPEHTMSDVDGFSEEESIRLANCILEPIRTPGAVQPHGTLLVVDPTALVIVAASENARELLGRGADTLLGQPLVELVGQPALDTLLEAAAHPEDGAEPHPMTVGETRFDVLASTGAEHLFVEFEPVIDGPAAVTVPAVLAAMRRLRRAETRQQLWDATARELHRLLDFDRVMVYHFHADEHGEVVAEERAADMEPYKGLHYPASDIPAQARELYLTKLSRVIADSSLEGSTLVSSLEGRIDLSAAELRSVSRHHLEFMHNMGQASTFSLSLVHRGRLIGMITCAHRTPLRLPFAVRHILEALADQVAMQLGAMNDVVRLERDAEFRGVRDNIVRQFADDGDLEAALLRSPVTVLDLISADGAALVVDGEVFLLGPVTVTAEMLALVRDLEEQRGGAAFVTDSLPHEFPELAAKLPDFAGLILVPIGSGGDCVAWFRREVAQSVDWLGDLSTANRPTTLSPRTSFSAWTESVTGRAIPWDGMEAQAEQLVREVERAGANRADAELAGFAMQDALTGLPNRRLLMDRIELALDDSTHDESVSLLFIDLDGFKQINDTLGHDAGDALLVQSANRILGATRADDTVARLGGDEFVVLCRGAHAEEADEIAARILSELRKPVKFDGREIAVTASIGAVSVTASFIGADLIREADAAMYRAKLNGRDRASR